MGNELIKYLQAITGYRLYYVRVYRSSLIAKSNRCKVMKSEMITMKNKYEA